MSFYRNLAAVIAAMGLATAAFADTNATTNSAAPAAAPQQAAAAPVQVADNSSASASDASQAATQDKVNLNKATTKQLMSVKGMSKAKAAAIVSYRKKHGDFKSVDDLKQVKGFKKMDDKTMKGLEDQLTIG